MFRQMDNQNFNGKEIGTKKCKIEIYMLTTKDDELYLLSQKDCNCQF